ncbi:MAG: hypothetical protein ABL973_17385 [Micropepsaceae bacterium]
MGVLMSQPLPLQLWLLWLGMMNLLVPLAFIRNIEARVIVVVFLLNAVFMNLLFVRMRYGPHLGLPHVIFWTPLVLWLSTRLDRISARGGRFPTYVYALIVTDAISLGIDYVDVVAQYQRFLPL